MSGEFMGVWSEAWRGIWAPLIDQEDVPEDVFCELYRELVVALREPSPEAAVAIAMGDAVQRREAFDRALVLADADVDLARRNEVFESVDGEVSSGVADVRNDLEGALAAIIGDLSRSKDALSEALGELVSRPEKRAEVLERVHENVIADKLRSREAFENARTDDIVGERSLVMFLEAAHGVCEDLGGDPLANLYFNLLARFVDKFSLRYDLRRPCTLCPTLPGMFASLLGGLRAATIGNIHLDGLMKDFEEAIRDLRIDCSDRRIKTCIQKEVNLLEAMGARCPGVTSDTIGRICEQVASWPHGKLKEAMKSIYAFTCDYPGIRHAGNPANAIRAIEMRDMVAVSVVLAGFAPYLTDQLDADKIYRGA